MPAKRQKRLGNLPPVPDPDHRATSLLPPTSNPRTHTHALPDALVPYARLYYCRVAGLPWPLRAAALLLLLAELVLLFRVLGSTAEDFLSPPLTQLSQEMGLPPRFAGGEPHLPCMAQGGWALRGVRRACAQHG